ncbi:hypothetical protein ESCO_005375 [Escovopsis weberi]|uniref:Uncharacterized protein n=1 Tax=Escovopsis weberi TaxID=150374 RepID=A0A0M8N028_ESCWE|nr:hypothetical protein ESCO_005375 [Escovopsis weberi]
MNPQRAALFAQDEADRMVRPGEPERQPRVRRQAGGDAMDTVNPERAALIDDREEAQAQAQGQGQGQGHARPRDEGRERGPRAPSPRRAGRYGHEPGPAASSGAHDVRHSIRPARTWPRGFQSHTSAAADGGGTAE